MHKLRTAITAMIALALAGLPVPAAAMHASMIAGAIDTIDKTAPNAKAGESHCCEQAENCETHTNKGCDRSDACAAKCATLSANLVAGMDLAPLPTPQLTEVALTERLQLTKRHPPSPPPRL